MARRLRRTLGTISILAVASWLLCLAAVVMQHRRGIGAFPPLSEALINATYQLAVVVFLGMAWLAAATTTPVAGIAVVVLAMAFAVWLVGVRPRTARNA